METNECAGWRVCWGRARCDWYADMDWGSENDWFGLRLNLDLDAEFARRM